MRSKPAKSPVPHPPTVLFMQVPSEWLRLPVPPGPRNINRIARLSRWLNSRQSDWGLVPLRRGKFFRLSRNWRLLIERLIAVRVATMSRRSIMKLIPSLIATNGRAIMSKSAEQVDESVTQAYMNISAPFSLSLASCRFELYLRRVYWRKVRPCVNITK